MGHTLSWLHLSMSISTTGYCANSDKWNSRRRCFSPNGKQLVEFRRPKREHQIEDLLSLFQENRKCSWREQNREWKKNFSFFSLSTKQSNAQTWKSELNINEHRVTAQSHRHSTTPTCQEHRLTAQSHRHSTAPTSQEHNLTTQSQALINESYQANTASLIITPNKRP